ncbi:hypothetical protein NOZ11_004430 [Vibrio parahaemolyticus]|nr:hypothetical protein [Vibrio parahaemolyticus]
MNKSESNLVPTVNPLCKFLTDMAYTAVVILLLSIVQGFDGKYVAGMFFNEPLIYSSIYAISIPFLSNIFLNLIIKNDSKFNSIYEIVNTLSYVMLAVLSALFLASLFVEKAPTIHIVILLMPVLILAVIEYYTKKRRDEGKNNKVGVFWFVIKFIFSFILLVIYITVIYFILGNAVDTQSCIIQYMKYSNQCDLVERYPLLILVKSYVVEGWGFIVESCRSF